MADPKDNLIDEMLSHVREMKENPALRGKSLPSNWAAVDPAVFGLSGRRALMKIAEQQIPACLPADLSVTDFLLMQLDPEERMSNFQCTADMDASQMLGDLDQPYQHASGLMMEAIYTLFVLLWNPVREDPAFAAVQEQAKENLLKVKGVLDEYALSPGLRDVATAIDVVLNPQNHVSLKSSATYLHEDDVYQSLHDISNSRALSNQTKTALRNHLEESPWRRLRFILHPQMGAEIDAELCVAETILFAAAPTVEQAHKLVTNSMTIPQCYARNMERQQQLWKAAQLTVRIWRSQNNDRGMLHEPRAYAMMAGPHNKSFDEGREHSLPTIISRLADAKAVSFDGRSEPSLPMIADALEAGPFQSGHEWENSPMRDALYMRIAETERRPLSTSIPLAFRQVAEMMQFPADDPHSLNAGQALYCGIYVDDQTQQEIFERYGATKITMYSKRGAALRIEGASTQAPVIAVFVSPSRISPDEMLDSDVDLRFTQSYLHAAAAPSGLSLIQGLPIDILRASIDMSCVHPNPKWEPLPILDLLSKEEETPLVPMASDAIDLRHQSVIGIAACCEECGRTRLASIPAWNLPARDDMLMEHKETMRRAYNMIEGYHGTVPVADIDELFAREPIIDPASISVQPHLTTSAPQANEPDIDWDDELYL